MVAISSEKPLPWLPSSGCVKSLSHVCVAISSEKPLPWLRSPGGHQRTGKSSCNLKREAAPLATPFSIRVPSTSQMVAISSEKPLPWLHISISDIRNGHNRCNLKREAAPLATSPTTGHFLPIPSLQSQARSRSPGYTEQVQALTPWLMVAISSEKPLPWLPDIKKAIVQRGVGCNLKREAAPLATEETARGRSAAPRCNLKREAAPLATPDSCRCRRDRP